MIVINFWGGAGIGKSTMAARAYTWLKERGCRAEITGEYAKELVYEDSMRVIADQLYLFAEQEHRLRCLQESGVEIAVCDSPSPLSIIYDREKDSALAQFIWTRFDRYKSINFLLKRNENMFTEKDRIDTLETARKADAEIQELLQKKGIPTIPVDMNDDDSWAAVERVLIDAFQEKNVAA